MRQTQNLESSIPSHPGCGWWRQHGQSAKTAGDQNRPGPTESEPAFPQDSQVTRVRIKSTWKQLHHGLQAQSYGHLTLTLTDFLCFSFLTVAEIEKRIFSSQPMALHTRFSKLPCFRLTKSIREKYPLSSPISRGPDLAPLGLDPKQCILTRTTRSVLCSLPPGRFLC